MGLYGGLRQKDIHSRKKLSGKQSILDHMNSEVLHRYLKIDYRFVNIIQI